MNRKSEIFPSVRANAVESQCPTAHDAIFGFAANDTFNPVLQTTIRE